MKEKIHILCVTDDAFALPYGVMLTSLLDNNRECDFCIWIISDTLSSRNLSYFKDTIESYGSELHLIFADNTYLSQLSLKRKDRYSKACYYCLFAADLLPDSISKVLYLDGDIIVLSNLIKLWQTNLENAALAGVMDFNYRKHAKRLNMKGKYINSGVLLLNLDYQRKNNIVEQFKKRLLYLDNHQDEVVFPDQDIINYVCDQKIVYLPIRYNLLTPFLLEGINLDDFNDGNGSVDTSNCIIHYAGYPKPWSFHFYDHPLKPEWMFYYARSKWRGIRVEKIPVWKLLLFPLLRILFKLRLINRNPRFKSRNDILKIKI